MGDRYAKSDEIKKFSYVYANNFYGHSMSQPLPIIEIKFEKKLFKKILNTLDDSDLGYFNEVDLKCPDNIKEKTKNFPFAPENKVIPKDKYNDHMKKIQPKNYIKSKKLKCDWTDRKN